MGTPAHWASSGGEERVASDVTNAAILASISPCPVQAVVKHVEALAGREFADQLGVSRGGDVKAGEHCDGPLQGFGVMRGDHPVCEGDVGQILPIGIELGIRGIGRTGEDELVSAGGRMPQLAR